MSIFQCILLINLQVVFDISIVFFNLSQSCLSLNETKRYKPITHTQVLILTEVENIWMKIGISRKPKTTIVWR